MKRFALASILLLLATVAHGAAIVGITAETVDGSGYSATALEVGNKTVSFVIEVWVETSGTRGGVTCNGWDTSAAAEVVWRCHRGDTASPWRLMENTAACDDTTDVGGVCAWGRALSGGCQIRLDVTDDGATNSACFVLGVTGAGFDETKERTDGTFGGDFVAP